MFVLYPRLGADLRMLASRKRGAKCQLADFAPAKEANSYGTRPVDPVRLEQQRTRSDLLRVLV